MVPAILDTRRLDSLGWKAKTSLAEGIQATYKWFLAQQSKHHADSARQR
jgi:nucleoside-diphosphate-sugar epimerase